MNVRVEAGWTPGIYGDVVALHARHYFSTYGWHEGFEAEMARDIGAFAERRRLHGPAAGEVFSAWEGETFLGSLIIDHGVPEAGPEEARVRWVILVPEARGKGVGKALLAAGLDHARAQGKTAVALWTQKGMEPAESFYKAQGFAAVEERAIVDWGEPFIGVFYRKSLTA